VPTANGPALPARSNARTMNWYCAPGVSWRTRLSELVVAASAQALPLTLCQSSYLPIPLEELGLPRSC
jgi:hypothetical protein